MHIDDELVGPRAVAHQRSHSYLTGPGAWRPSLAHRAPARHRARHRQGSPCRCCRRVFRWSGSAWIPSTRAAAWSAGATAARESGRAGQFRVRHCRADADLARIEPHAAKLRDAPDRHDIPEYPLAPVDLDHHVGAAGDDRGLQLRQCIQRLLERRRSCDRHPGDARSPLLQARCRCATAPNLRPNPPRGTRMDVRRPNAGRCRRGG